MKYLKLKIEDAVNATKSAVDEGVVAGGGSTLAKTAAHLEQKISKNESKMSTEEKIGYEIVFKALKSPLRQIAHNAGKEDPGVVIDAVMKGSKNAGYDALQDMMIEDMIASGIIDPVKVTRNAVANAISAAAILLTTEVAIADIADKKDDHAGHDHGMGGY